MTRDTRIALFLIGELVAALRANDPDLFKRWQAQQQNSTGAAMNDYKTAVTASADSSPACKAPWI